MTAEELVNEFWEWLNETGAKRILNTTTEEFACFVVDVVLPRETEEAREDGRWENPV